MVELKVETKHIEGLPAEACRSAQSSAGRREFIIQLLLSESQINRIKVHGFE
jgi:hypothetical protein